MGASELQETIWAILALALVVAAVLGHWPRLAASYTEGDRRMVLHHVGPLVWGDCTLDEGQERYVGLTLLGHLYLRRFDSGARLLVGRGFPKEQVHALDGICTGYFQLHQDATEDLTGHFCGRRFSLNNGRMVPVETLTAVPRHWRRL